MYKKILLMLLSAALACGTVAPVGAETVSSGPFEWSIPPKANVINTYSKLEDRMNNAVVLMVGRSTAFVNNERTQIDENPEITPVFVNDDVFVPIRFIAESIASVVEWDDQNNEICIMHSTVTINLKVGGSTMTVHNTKTEEVELDEPVQVINGRAMLPLRKFVEAMGKSVFWDERGLIFICDKEDMPELPRDKEQIDEAVELFNSESLEPVKIYVSPNAKGGDGSINKPYGSIRAAQEAVRRYIGQTMNRDVEVILRGGVYELDAPLTFGPRDSGNNYHKVIYKSYGSEEPVITGGRKIEIWKPYKDGIYEARINPSWNVNTLFENDVRGFKARYPNQGWLKWTPDTPNEGPKFIYNEGDLPEVKNTSGMEAVFWAIDCFVFIRNVKNIDYSRRCVTLDDVPYGVNAGTRYFMQGSMEYLDNYGEFYNDNNGRLFYKPRAGNPSKLDIEAPVLFDHTIKFAGQSAENPVKNIVFDGITIKNSAVGYDLINMSYARNIVIRNCVLKNSGRNIIEMSEWAQNNQITGNHMYNIGYQGVDAAGTGGILRAVNRNHTISNNHIHGIGQLIGDGAGIRLFVSKSNRVEHNLIYESGRYCISLSGFDVYDWAYRQTLEGVEPTYENRNAFSHVNDNIIAFNDCSRSGRDSSDVSPISLWNTDPGNIIYNNRVHDSGSAFGFHFGLYLDDRVENTLVKNNIVDNFCNIEGGGSLNASIMAKGLYNVIDNNYFINNPQASVGAFQNYSDERDDMYKVATKNIFYNSGENLYHFTNWKENKMVEVDNNLYFNDSGNYLIGGDAPVTTYEGWRGLLSGRYDQHSKIANPQFVNDKGGDYRLRYDSPAYGLGIKDIDIWGIGLEGSYPYADAKEALGRVFVRPEGAETDRSYIDMTVGESIAVKVGARSETGYVMTLSPDNVTYTSDNTRVASVDKDGHVTGLSTGMAKLTVTVTKNGKSMSCMLDILVGDELESIELNMPETLLSKDKTYEIHAVGRTKFGRELALREVQLEADELFKVSGKRLITAEKTGSGNLYISADWRGKQKRETIPVEVVDGLIDKINVAVGKTWLKTGESTALSVSAVKDNGTPIPAKELTVHLSANGVNFADTDTSATTFTSSEPGVVSITADVDWKGIKKQKTIQVVVEPKAGKLPEPWRFANIGGARGFAVSSDKNLFSILTDGLDIFGAQDQFSYMYQEVDLSQKNDITVLCTVDPYKFRATDGSAIGLMIRSSLEASANHFNVRICGDGAVRVVYRNPQNPNSNWMGAGNVTLPQQVKLEKKGDSVTASYTDSGKWFTIGSANIPLSGKVYVGVAFMANGKGAISEGCVSDFSIE